MENYENFYRPLSIIPDSDKTMFSTSMQSNNSSRSKNEHKVVIIINFPAVYRTIINFYNTLSENGFSTKKINFYLHILVHVHTKFMNPLKAPPSRLWDKSWKSLWLSWCCDIIFFSWNSCT